MASSAGSGRSRTPASMRTSCANGRSCEGPITASLCRTGSRRRPRRRSGWFGRSCKPLSVAVRRPFDTGPHRLLGQTPVVRKVLATVFVAATLVVAGGAYAWSELVPGPPMTIAILPGDEVALAPTAQFQFAADVGDPRNRAVGMKPTWTSDAPEAPIAQRGALPAPGPA